MNEIKIFNNPQFGEIRTATNESGEPLFCFADVCSILGLQTNKVKERLIKNGWCTIPLIDSLGRTQQAIFITEPNLYKTVFQSRKPESEKLTDWVSSDVLPSIRRTGSFGSIEKPKTLVELHFESAKILLEHENKINEISSKLDKMLEASQANEAAMKALPISSEELPELPLRDKVRMMVNSYAAAKLVDIKSVWDAAYGKLYYTYNISVNAYKSVKKGQSKLDLLDEKGHINKLYVIVSDMCRNANVTTV